MALRDVIRTEGAEPVAYTDHLFRCVMKDAGAGVEIWGEWTVDLGNGRTAVRSARCDLLDETWILALPNIQAALDRVKASTHPKVTA